MYTFYTLKPVFFGGKTHFLANATYDSHDCGYFSDKYPAKNANILLAF